MILRVCDFVANLILAVLRGDRKLLLNLVLVVGIVALLFAYARFLVGNFAWYAAHLSWSWSQRNPDAYVRWNRIFDGFESRGSEESAAALVVALPLGIAAVSVTRPTPAGSILLASGFAAGAHACAGGVVVPACSQHRLTSQTWRGTTGAACRPFVSIMPVAGLHASPYK